MSFVSTRQSMIHIFHEDLPNKLSQVETIKTEYGAKAMQIDPKTHNLFLSMSDFDPPAAPTEKSPIRFQERSEETFACCFTGVDFDRSEGM
jgi:hypothetical protein